MSETSISKNYVDSPYTLRQIIVQAYNGPFRDRKENAKRDIKRRVKVETVIVWKLNYVNNVPEREKVHTYRIKVVSVSPNGKVSNYPVVILLNSLSIDSPCKLRCGGYFKYTNKDTMDEKQICGDFRFRFEAVLASIGVLFGRNTTNRIQPSMTNPSSSIGICKHIWGAVSDLVQFGLFKKPAGKEESSKAAEFIEGFN